MPYVWLTIHDLACIAATVIFVLTDHPWWTIAVLVPLYYTGISPASRSN